MATQVRVSAENHAKATKLARDFESAGLGNLTADKIFEAGLKVKQALFNSLLKKGK